jgi:hypothetical protein
MKIKEKDFNVVTGEETITERDETPAETKMRLELIAESEALLIQKAIKATEKAALLVKLGITEDEARLLLG